ncbi:hypothetical protein AS029_08040 [Microbacterium enclense]|nr:hypothetical protein AS029_08040 [Microbacterium enclense]
MLILAVVVSGCATPGGGAASPVATETSVSASATPTPAPTQSDVPEVAPTPTGEPIPNPVPTVTGSASVTIVNWHGDGRILSASGLVTGAQQTDGRCTLTATSSSGQVLTGEVEAQSTPAAINCGLIDIPAPTGSWQLVLSYRDGDDLLSSAPVTVEQPR